MPKNSVHGGPSNKQEPMLFGAALAAARADIPIPAPRYVGTCPVCDQPVSQVTHSVVPVEGEPTATGFATYTAGPAGSRFEPCGHITGVWIDQPADAVAALASEDLEPTVSVTVGTGGVGGDGAASSFGDHLRAGGGQGGAGQTDPEATTTVTVTVTGADGGEQPSPGNSSSTSAKKPRKNAAAPKPPSQSRARGTGSRSRTPAADSTAGSADDAATNSADNN